MIQPGDVVITARLWRTMPPQVFDLVLPEMENRCYEFVRSEGDTVIVKDLETGEELTFYATMAELYAAKDLEHYFKHMREVSIKVCKILDEGSRTAAQFYQLLTNHPLFEEWGARGEPLREMRTAVAHMVPTKCCSVGNLNVPGATVTERCDQETYDWVNDPKMKTLFDAKLNPPPELPKKRVRSKKV